MILKAESRSGREGGGTRGGERRAHLSFKLTPKPSLLIPIDSLSSDMATPTTLAPRKNAGVFLPLPATKSWRQFAFVWIIQGLAAGVSTFDARPFSHPSYR